MDFKRVTMEEYISFIKAYPNKLEFDCTGICDPPLETYNDFNLAPSWPDSVVAKCNREFRGPNHEINDEIPGKFWEYYIRTDINKEIV